jgi:orotate phosphoribosyltransferase
VSDVSTDLVRKGHFVFESGHHGDTWLDLDLLISQPRRLRTLAADLAARLTPFGADLVCGPLDGGAFLAQWVAAALDLTFTYTRPPGYRLAGIPVAGRHAVVVDDAINVGSATIATTEALRSAGCAVIALASVLVCTPNGPHVGARLGVPQVYLEAVTSRVWTAEECPYEE